MDRQLHLIKCHSKLILKELGESVKTLYNARNHDDDEDLMKLAEQLAAADLPSNIEALEVSNQSISALLQTK